MKSLPIINRKIRWALSGCGRISANHLSAIKELEHEIELVAVCDVIPERADNLASNSTKAYVNFEDMINKENIDILSLCTPSGIHPQQSIAASKKGIHVLTEKPMGTQFRHGLQMIQASEDNDTRLYVVKQNRMNPTIQKLKGAVDEGRFGKIYFAQVNVFWTRPQEYYDQAPWRGTRELDGGAMMNQASHCIDLLDWLVGPVAEVSAHSATLARNIEMEDTAAVSFKLKNGGLGSINVTMLTYPQNLEGSITILGEKGTVKVGGVAVNKIEKWEFMDQKDSINDLTETSYPTDSVYGFGHPVVYKNIVKDLRGEYSVVCDGQSGLKSLELLQAIYDSIELKKSVSLPLPRNI